MFYWCHIWNRQLPTIMLILTTSQSLRPLQIAQWAGPKYQRCNALRIHTRHYKHMAIWSRRIRQIMLATLVMNAWLCDPMACLATNLLDYKQLRMGFQQRLPWARCWSAEKIQSIDYEQFINHRWNYGVTPIIWNFLHRDVATWFTLLPTSEWIKAKSGCLGNGTRLCTTISCHRICRAATLLPAHSLPLEVPWRRPASTLAESTPSSPMGTSNSSNKPSKPTFGEPSAHAMAEK